MKTLTPKQQRFVEEYLVDLNATQAYLRAGYKSSEEAARRNGARLMANADIANAIAAQRGEISKRVGRTIDDIMADIGRVRNNAMQEVVDPETGAMVMVSHKDALKALELEGKRFGAWTEKLDISNKDGTLKPSVIRIVAQPIKPTE